MEPNGHRRARTRDPLVQENGDAGLSYSVDELDPWTAWAYKPCTISLLFIGACFLICSCEPFCRGVWAMIAVFLAFCLLQAPSTVLIRPHPAIWRLVHGMAVVYLVALTFLLFQEMLFDEFVLAHIFGWWGKAILIHNQPLLWVLSIGFELMEFSFQHMLPNFNECWWDGIILDILTCNWFGIWAGMHTVRYFDGRTYQWVGISRQPNIIGKWDKDEWHPLLGPWRFIQVLSLCIVFLTVELNTFFLKFCLWIPPRNPVILYRLILWWLITVPTIREYNSYLQDRFIS
ncbi:CDP-diacylglycerol--serine O-phosphatidyltransferase 1-like isoform X2 [Durio zibethinus]|uniref:CDP-diacylglycerol--serine O-phosphatidyltransferase n=1 Tax=Durio zibethinus TaxID=66656 RepID=A0A6P6BFR0_DURZI|nr:CDP-diacylglycerol--serine O-phosphatidyltransferase 1-like isoform X2 [Durio zibethinus]